MKNNKSPGLDGFTVEFFIFLVVWLILGNLFYDQLIVVIKWVFKYNTEARVNYVLTKTE